MKHSLLSVKNTELRGRPQRRLHERMPDATAAQSAQDMQRLLYELQVYQIELEMQNEQLRESQAQLQAATERYVDRYDCAPVGYFSLDPDGIMTSLNLIGASLLGQERARLEGQHFVAFVLGSQQLLFSSFFEQVLKTKARHSCELDLVVEDRPVSAVRIEASLSANGLECHMIVIDLTERHQAEAAQRLILAKHARMSERDRLLQDLHDGFASQLATACLRNDHSQLTKDQIGALLRECLDDLYLVVDTLGRADRNLNEALADYRYRCDSRLSGLAVQIDWDIELCSCPPCGCLPCGSRRILNIMRILQESLNNAVKHAQARHVWVEARCHPGGGLRITVCDDGIGIPLDLRRGRGLNNINKRAREIGGVLEVTRLRPGTRVSLTLSQPSITTS